MEEKLDLYDKKLLYELDKNSSIELSELSKKLRRSKQFILYRMKQLEESNIITGYNAIVDMSKLGYFSFRVYFKFQQTTIEDGSRFVDYVKRNFHQVECLQCRIEHTSRFLQYDQYLQSQSANADFALHHEYL